MGAMGRGRQCAAHGFEEAQVPASSDSGARGGAASIQRNWGNAAAGCAKPQRRGGRQEVRGAKENKGNSSQRIAGR